MDTVRRQLANLADDPDYNEGAKLTPKQERFAQVWARTDNQTAAYREAYNVRPDTPLGSVWSYASRIANLPQVKARYHVLHEEAANETLLSLREALHWQIDIATADPNELVRVLVHNCRHCWGVGYAYQWRDELEYLDACAAAIDAQKPTPSDAGGYGFTGLQEPNPCCAKCYGQGVKHEYISDTTKLTGKARKLYAGAEVDRFGVIKIKMHDQDAAWDKVLRMRGAYNDKLDLRTPQQRAEETARAKLPDNITLEDASKAYITLLG